MVLMVQVHLSPSASIIRTNNTAMEGSGLVVSDQEVVQAPVFLGRNVVGGA